MQRLTYVLSISLSHYQRCVQVNVRLCVCTGFALRPMTVVFGLQTRLCVRMCTRLENGVLHKRQQPGSAVNSFIDLEAMKMLSRRRAPRWGISLSLLNKVVRTKRERKNSKNGTLATADLHLAVFARLWTTIPVLPIIKALKEKVWALKYAFSVFVVKLYGFCLSIAYDCTSTSSLRRESIEVLQ